MPGPKAAKGVPNGSETGEDVIPRRPLGKTSVQVLALGLGGYHLGDADTVKEAMNIVHEAIDYGIDFFDTCWEYHTGEPENRLARALAGRRDKVFFMTKVGADGRDKKVVMQQLEESLKRLRTNHLDLW